MQFANFVLQQAAFDRGLLRRIIAVGGSAGDNSASFLTDLTQGEQYTTAIERDLILQSGGFLSQVASQSIVPAPVPVPIPGTAGTAVWGLRVNARNPGTTDNRSPITATCIDPSGNVYAGGWYLGATFAVNRYTSKSGTSFSQSLFGILPFVGSTSNGSFIIKYNSSGAVLWATSFAPVTNSCELYQMITDSNGNLYTIHSFTGTISINSYNNDGGSGGTMTPLLFANLTSAGGYDIVIVKHNSSGVVQWASHISGAGQDFTKYASSNNIAIDSNGNLIVAFVSDTSGTLTFKNYSSVSGGVITFTTFGALTGGFTSGYLCKINSSGAFQWVSQLKQAYSATESSIGVCLDSSDNAYVIVSQQQITDLMSFSNVTTGTINLTKWGAVNRLGASDALVVKVNSSGTFTAAARVGGPSKICSAPCITIDSANNVYIAFNVVYALDQILNVYSSSGTDPAGGTVTFTAWGNIPADVASSRNGPLIKFSSSLVCQAATYITCSQVAATRIAQMMSLAVDSDNNVYGFARYNADMRIYSFSSGGAGINQAIVTTTLGTLPLQNAVGSYDLAILRFNSSLTAQWATRLSSSVAQSDLPYSISINKTTNEIYVGGSFIANNTDGFQLFDYTSITSSAINVTLSGTISSAATDATAFEQGFLAKYI